MSYNKQTSLAANVEAIETAVKIHVQGRKAMAKEKETLSRYSGFGGIKEVLNIGTDNPLPDNMAEPMNRLQKALRTLAGGEETMYRKARRTASRPLSSRPFTRRSSSWMP